MNIFNIVSSLLFILVIIIYIYNSEYLQYNNQTFNDKNNYHNLFMMSKWLI